MSQDHESEITNYFKFISEKGEYIIEKVKGGIKITPKETNILKRYTMIFIIFLLIMAIFLLAFIYEELKEINQKIKILNDEKNT